MLAFYFPGGNIAMSTRNSFGEICVYFADFAF